MGSRRGLPGAAWSLSLHLFMPIEAKFPKRPDVTSLGVRLCLSCGLCCDGTLFRDVELQAADDLSRRAMADVLDATHLNLAQKSKWPQPCAALCADLRCQIYADRPSRCRDFECELFKAVASGTFETDEALKVIRK